ncbi:MAG: metal ABC transporter ATP-binding protein [Anaerolineales bacterium]
MRDFEYFTNHALGMEYNTQYPISNLQYPPMFQRLQSSFHFRNVRHENDTAILDVSDLTVRYNGVAALDSVSFQLRIGERVAVVGPNGAGKSTLFKVVAGVLPATHGEVKVFGHGPEGHICIAYVPQRSQVDWRFPVNVADVVMMGRIGKIGLFRWPQKRDWDVVRESLDLVGMTHLAKRQIGELSGGQQQRVFIAQALAQKADLILMDEPLNGLDAPSQEAIFDLLDELKRRHVTVMVATHDLHIAAERFDRVMLLNRKLLGFGLPFEIIAPERLVEAYGGQMQVIATPDGKQVMIEECCHDGAEPERAIDGLGTAS